MTKYFHAYIPPVDCSVLFRAYIDPILVGATLVAASTSTGAGSSSLTPGVVGPQARQRNLRLRTEKLLVGYKAVGKVDWVILYRTLAVIVAEVRV